MTHWIVRYRLACGHDSGRVSTTETSKRVPGDTWPCVICGTDEEIVHEEGHGT